MAQPDRRRLSRRAFLSAGTAAALGGGAALVFGCGGGSSGRPSQTSNSGGAGGPRQGGEIVIGRHGPLLGIDPHVDAEVQDIAQLVYSHLYTWSAETAIFNDFALSVEIPDDQRQEFIFTLRQGVKVHSHPDNPASGAELTAEDCKQSFIRRGTVITAADKRLALAITGTRSPDVAALASALQTPDPYTFSFKLTRPFAGAFRDIARPEWAIIPATVIDKYGKSFSDTSLGTLAFGSGPFMLDEFRGTERIVLIRHPEYFLSPRPWLDRITFVITPDQADLISGLESGSFDAIAPPISREKYLELKDDSRFTVSRAPTLSYPSIQLKMQPPFSDIRVREAIDLAINRDRFIEAIWGGEANYNGPIAWPLTSWVLPQEELRGAYPYDPDRARALLAEAGHPDGFAARMTLPRRVPNAVFDVAKAASVVAEDLSEVGVEVRLEKVDSGAFMAGTLLPGSFEMAFFPSTPYDEPDDPLSIYHSSGVIGVDNWTGYSNPEVDALLDSQSIELDENKRSAIIHEAQRLIIEEHGPQITLPSGYEYHARRSYVHYPYEIGESPSGDAGPWGCDIWTEEA